MYMRGIIRRILITGNPTKPPSPLLRSPPRLTFANHPERYRRNIVFAFNCSIASLATFLATAQKRALRVVSRWRGNDDTGANLFPVVRTRALTAPTVTSSLCLVNAILIYFGKSIRRRIIAPPVSRIRQTHTDTVIRRECEVDVKLVRNE